MKTKCCKKKFKILINLLFIFAILTFSFFTLKVFAGSAASIDRIKSGGVSSIGKTADIAFGNEHGADALGSGRKDLYCIRKGHFMGDKTWTVRGYVQIVGNNATSWDRSKNKKTSLHNINGEVAYILGKEQGYGSAKKVEGGHQDKYSAGQMALYTKIDSFCKENGLIGFTGGNPSTISGFAETDYEAGVDKKAKTMLTEAEKYAKNLGNTDSNVKVNNLTQIDNIKFDSYLWSDNKTYTRIGPFRLSFSGTMKDVYITDQNNNKISPIWIEKYVGNSLKYIDASQIESNKDFYITICNDGKVNKINKIGGNLDVPGNIKSAEVWILEHTEKQNLLLAKPSNKPLTGSFNIDLYIKLFGNIAIEKIDKDNNNIKLKSVKFIVRNVATGEYITGYDKGSQSATTYGNKSNAYEFVTDQNGKIVIKNVYVGQYEFIEIDNPNYGYRVSEAPIYKVLSSDGITYYTAINEQFIGNIAIEKVDLENNSKKLQGVSFIVRYVDTGEYISDVMSDKVLYTSDSGNAKVFVTDDQGKILIENVLDGDYEFIEVENPNYGYRVEETPLYKVSTTDGITYYTAINEQFIGNIAIEKVDLENHDKKLANVSFIVRYVDTGEYISEVLPDIKEVRYTKNIDEAKVFVTDDQGKILIENVLDGEYEFIETENPNYGYRVEETPLYKVSTTDEITYYTAENEQFIGDIGLEKVDTDNHENKLQGVQFIVRYVDTDEYVSEVLPEIKEARYTKNREEAMIFTTDEEGKIIVQNLLDGDYEFIEVAIPQYGYVVSEEPIKTTTADEVVYVMMENKQLYIKISGDVWEDILFGKDSTKNYKYKDVSEDINDRLVEGVNVSLKTKDANGNYVLVKSQYEDETGIHDLNPEVTTDENGHYVFEGVEIEKLGDYYIDFEYDGLLYQSVPDEYAIIDGNPEKIKYTELETAVVNKTANGKAENLDFKNTSKAVEWHWDQKGTEYEAVRDQFNNKFGEISNNSPNSVIVTNFGKELFYKVPGENGYGAEFERDNKANFCEIIASTNYFGSFLDIPGSIGNSVEEITHINLGIYERAQTDLAIMKDLEQVKVGIKGYDHIYRYASRFDNEGKPKDGSWDLGVKFTNENGKSNYDVEVYESDYKYTGKEELNMTMTYRIVLRNESTINTRVNSIVDEFTGLNGFGKVTVGTEFDEESDKVTGLLDVPNNGRNGSQMVINTSGLDLDPVNSPTRDIYIQVELSRSDVENLVGKGIIENKVEINSYTSYDENGKLYAAVDIDSVPGNMNSNLEDDNDKAPDVAIISPNDKKRTVSGIVFEDGYIVNMKDDYNIREGNGKYDNGESKVSGVIVELLEKVGDNKYVVKQKLNQDGNMENICFTTGQDGNYKLSGFEPGEYKIRFTWGNGIQKTFGSSENYHDVTVNYKGTVFDKDRYEKENNNSRFYQGGFSEDLTHAIDDWDKRTKIDTKLNSHSGGENNGYNYATSVPEYEMLSDTCMMNFPVEIDDETDTGVITEFGEPLEKYLVDKMSFGIAERAKQSLVFDKWVSNVKVTLPDGRVLADAIITKDGNISGLTDYVSFVSNGTGIRSNSFVKIEMDAELMQTSDLEIVYKYCIENTSEADFANANYYKYGYKFINNSEKDSDIVKITPSKIVDYLDSKNMFRIDHAKNLDAGWELTTFDQLNTNNIVSAEAINGIDKKLFNCYLTEKSESIAPRYKSAAENPAGKTTFELVAGNILAIDSNIDYINQVEIVEINKPFGSKIECIPGNYKPNSSIYEIDTAISEKVKVMKSTGGNGNNVIITTAISIGLLSTFGIGLYLIKKKVL